MAFCLVMKDGKDERKFPLDKPRTVIGREASSDVRISIPSVGPRHCEITLLRDELRLTDLGSNTGTLHNGQPVREAILSDLDRLTVGPVTFEVRRDATHS